MKTNTLILLVLAGICFSPVFAKQTLNEDTPPIYTEGGGFTPDKLVVYKDHPKRPLQLHIFLPPGFKTDDARPAIVFFFGGGWSGTNTKQFYPQSKYLASRGMVAICASYRATSAYKTQPYHCIEDGKSAIRYVRKHAKQLGIDPKKVAAGGGSAGGHIAAATATMKDWDCPEDDLSISTIPDALVLFNPVYDNGPGGYGNNEKDKRVADYWQKFSPLHNLDGNQPPTLVMMGSRDGLTSVETTQLYDKKMEDNGNRCETVIYEDQKHGFFNIKKGGPEYFIKTVTETDKFLSSLGFLKGQPNAQTWFAVQEKGYEANWRSLRTHQVPQWAKDAKFGIYAHCGVYSVGCDWDVDKNWANDVICAYRGFYSPSTKNDKRREFEKHIGPVAEGYGYKDLAKQFKAENFDPAYWADLIKRSGARYAGICAIHHDGYAIWDSDVMELNAGKLGSGPIEFKRTAEAFEIYLPQKLPNEWALSFRIQVQGKLEKTKPSYDEKLVELPRQT